MPTIPAPPPERLRPSPVAVWALWLALAPGVTLEQVAAALRGDR
jgi:hypothetical protein